MTVDDTAARGARVDRVLTMAEHLAREELSQAFAIALGTPDPRGDLVAAVNYLAGRVKEDAERRAMPVEEYLDRLRVLWMEAQERRDGQPRRGGADAA
ncbi:hypothetical protein NUM3379_26120 [Kineococcus sp. NUM-3379]